MISPKMRAPPPHHAPSVGMTPPPIWGIVRVHLVLAPPIKFQPDGWHRQKNDFLLPFLDCLLGCFIFNLFSPVLPSRPDSHYIIHLMKFGAQYFILKPISCYAEIRQSFENDGGSKIKMFKS